jgi:hypothetical protein
MPFDGEEISGRLSRTPEGFLICRDSVLSRCGDQAYHASELLDAGVEPGTGGWVTVTRDASEVFAPRSLAGFDGRPVVFAEHPNTMVDGSNYRTLSVGHIMGPGRRGEGDVVLGDIMLHDARAIEGVLSGTHRSLSVGYSASYRPLGRGRASQHDITPNHLALLRTGEARCGDVCVVRDARGDRKMRRMIRDQSIRGEHNEWQRSPNFSNAMGETSNGKVGPSLVMTLPGHSSNYFVVDLGPGKVGICCSSEIAGKLNMGTMATGANMLPDATEAVRRQQVRNDDAWCRQTLQGVNRRNAEFWKQNGGG